MAEKPKKEIEIEDVQASISGNIGLSPLERLLTLLETAKTAYDVQKAATIADSILSSRKDKAGKFIYYNAKPDSSEDKLKSEAGMINLYSNFKAVYAAHGQNKVTTIFQTNGVTLTVGDSFNLDVPHEHADKAIVAAEKEGENQDLAAALEAMSPIMSKIGKEGLMDPRRKVSIAGKVGEMMGAIDQDVEVLEILLLERDKERADFKKECDKDYKNLQKDHEKLKESVNDGV